MLNLSGLGQKMKTLARGHIEICKVDIGPYPVTISGNNVEGLRFD